MSSNARTRSRRLYFKGILQNPVGKSSLISCQNYNVKVLRFSVWTSDCCVGFFFNKKISLYIKFRFAAKTYLLTFAKWTWHVFRVFSIIIGWKNPHKTWILAYGFSAIFLAGLCFTIFPNLQLHLLLSVNISKKWTEFAIWRKKRIRRMSECNFYGLEVKICVRKCCVCGRRSCPEGNCWTPHRSSVPQKEVKMQPLCWLESFPVQGVVFNNYWKCKKSINTGLISTIYQGSSKSVPQTKVVSVQSCLFLGF